MLRRFEYGYTDIEFPGRYVLSEARFPEISDRIRNEEGENHEPASLVQ